MFKTLALATAMTALVAMPASAQDVDLSSVSTAVGAAQTAGLAETLASSEGITVFVPTNDAIAALPADALNALLGDQAKLASTITYYAVPGKVMAADVVKLLGDNNGTATVTTVNGGDLTLTLDGETITVAGAAGSAKIVATDVTIGNVIVHVIDGAFLPAS